MRDDRGEMLPNAHLLGFFRRICRLVWGGGCPPPPPPAARRPLHTALMHHPTLNPQPTHATHRDPRPPLPPPKPRLLFNKVRPVFVFDGATPALKRLTTAARRRRREEQSASLKRTAEKLLLNQLKKHALEQARTYAQQQVRRLRRVPLLGVRLGACGRL